jgi:hypothetical protein
LNNQTIENNSGKQKNRNEVPLDELVQQLACVRQGEFHFVVRLPEASPEVAELVE